MREHHGADTEVREGGDEVLQLPEQRSPLLPMVKQAACLQTMKDHTKADVHTAAHRGPHAGAGGHPQKALQPVESPDRRESFS